MSKQTKTSKKAAHQPVESVADFKCRLAIARRKQETGKSYSIIGAAQPDDCVVRPSALRRRFEAVSQKVAGLGHDAINQYVTDQDDRKLLAAHADLLKHRGSPGVDVVLEAITAELVSRGFNHLLDIEA